MILEENGIGWGSCRILFNTRNGFEFKQKWVLTNVREIQRDLRPIRSRRPVLQ